MHLTIPTNWDNNLIKSLDKTRVSEVYGKLNKDLVGGGRPAVMLLDINKTSAEQHISLIHKEGMKFNYLLNAPCMGNNEWSPKSQKNLRKLLDWLSKISVDSLTISIPYLLEIVKKNYPHFKTNISVANAIDNPVTARHWEDLGADQLTLSVWDINRNFNTLQKIRKSVQCQLQLIANLQCLHGCPFHDYHFTACGHASQEHDINNNFYVDYSMLSCWSLRLSEPWRLISAGWIRPEDLHFYQEIGINKIKLIDRCMKTEVILKIVNAYTKENYDGNLLDLFLLPDNYQISSPQHNWRNFFAFFHPLKTNIFHFRNSLRPISEKNQIYLNNRALDGFLKHFIQNDCSQQNCAECGYCNRIAEKALFIPPEYKKRMLKTYKQVLSTIIKGDMFNINRDKKTP